MIHEIECFLFVKIWLAYPFLWLYCVWFSICDDRVLTREQMVLQMDLWEII